MYKNNYSNIHFAEDIMIKKLQEKDIDNWPELFDLLNKLGSDYFYRGMSNKKYHLMTSEERLLDEIQKTNNNPILAGQQQNVLLELLISDWFIDMNKYSPNNITDLKVFTDENFLKIFAIHQHYGYPTRFLDWTLNWKKALYFCVNDNKESKADYFSLWCLKRKCVPNIQSFLSNQKHLEEKYGDLIGYSKIMTFMHGLPFGVYLVDNLNFERIRRQEGVFLVTSDCENLSFEDVIRHCNYITYDDLLKINIKKELRDNISSFLKRNGITKDYLFPCEFNEPYEKQETEKLKNIINLIYPEKICFYRTLA